MAPRLPRLAWPLLALLATAGIVAAAVAGNAPGSVAVHDVKFLRGPEVQGNLTVEAILYLTSPERPSRALTLEVYFYPRGGGLAEDRQDIAVGVVPGHRTREVRVPLALPADRPSSWHVEFLLFEDGLLTQRGSGSVGWVLDLLHDGAASRIEASASPFEAVR